MQATIVWVQIKDMNVRAFEIFVFKLTFLLSFCGGPLFVADLLKSMLGTDIAFLTAFLPVGVAGRWWRRGSGWN